MQSTQRQPRWQRKRRHKQVDLVSLMRDVAAKLPDDGRRQFLLSTGLDVLKRRQLAKGAK